MIAVAAADNATDVRIGTAAFALRIGQTGQQFGIIIEIIDVHFGELLRSQDLDADRYFLQVFRALLRGHSHRIKDGLLVFGRSLVIRAGQSRRAERHVNRSRKRQTRHSELRLHFLLCFHLLSFW